MRHYRALAADLVWVALSPFVALLIRDNFVFYEPHWDAIIPYAGFNILAGVVVFGAFRPHKTLWHYTSLTDILRIAAAVTITIFLALALSFVSSRLDGVARSIPVIQWLILIGALAWIRLLARIWHEHHHRRDVVLGEPSRQHVLIIGVSHVTELYLESLAEYGKQTLEVVGILSSQRALGGRLLRNQTILGTSEDLPKVISELEVHGVAVDRIAVMQPIKRLSRSARDAILAIERGSNVKVDWLTERLGFSDEIKSEDRRDAGTPLRSRQSMATEKLELLTLGRYGYTKRAIDIVLATCIIVVLSPVALLIAILVAIDVGLPVVFWQKRPGREVNPLKLYKFRTMRASHDRDGNRIPDEHRATRLGNLLRRTRLDELPQLYNVLVGEMSFIGPRPLLSRDQPDDMMTRLSVRPGLTGLAQVHGDRTISPNDKNALDIWYIKNASLWLDTKIMLRTLLVFVRGERINVKMLELAWDAIDKMNRQDAVGPLDVAENAKIEMLRIAG